MKIRPLRITLLLVGLAFFVARVSGQMSFKNIENYSGLPDNSVNAISQDRRGFIWMGTANGLCCYDGISFNSFFHSSTDYFSIFNNNVHKVLPFADHGVYAVTDGGLCFYSFVSGQFLGCHYLERDKKIRLHARFTSLIAVDGKVFVVGDDGKIYVGSGEAPTLFTPLNHKASFSVVTSYIGNMLIAAGPKGIYLLSDGGKRILSSYPLSTAPTFKQNLYFSRNTNMVYLGNGIGFATEVFSVVGMRIVKSEATAPGNLMSVTDIGRDIVFGIDGEGLHVWKADGTVAVYNTGNSNISSDAVYSLFTDRENNLWVGTYRGGVNLRLFNTDMFTVYNRANGKLTYNLVTGVTIADNKIYLGLDGGGFNVYDCATGAVRAFTTANSGIPGNNVISLSKDSDCVWMAVYKQGLSRFSPADNSFATWRMPANGVSTENDVWVVKDDGIGRIWVGGTTLYVMHKATGHIDRIASPPYPGCSSIAVRGNEVWVATNKNGLFVYDRRTLRLLHHYTTTTRGITLPADDLKYIYFDSRGLLWLSSENAGLYSVNVSDGHVKSYDNHGLTNSNVTSVVEDANGNLWMGTNNGLFRFDREAETFIRFDAKYLMSSVYTYDANARAGNTIYFGTTKGLLVFNTGRVDKCGSDYNVGFMSLEIINSKEKRINIYGDHPRDVVLDYNENFFTINFSKPDMSSPADVLYSYRLKGFEESWRTGANTRKVSYTNVPPGTYEFHVRTTDSHGKWMKPAVLRIIITPPWWKTAWAIVLWATMLLVVIVVLLKSWLRNLAIKHKVQIQEIERAASDKFNEEKMSFYANIVHELRTPIFLISANIEELISMKNREASVSVGSLRAIQRNTSKLSRLIDRIVDFRKMGKGFSKLHAARYDVVDFCRMLTDDYQDLFDQKKIDLSFESNKNEIMLCFDADKLTIVISNLLSNAFKYTRENGMVALCLTDSDSEVRFQLEDNGLGIEEKMRDTIFENFFRSDNDGQQDDNMGLSLVRSLVELHGGTITCRSADDGGTLFLFNIPKTGIAPDCVSAEADAGGTPSDEKAVVTNPMATNTLLVIDDDAESIEVLERSLAVDFMVLTARDVDEGQKLAADNLPDLIICDIVKSKTNGLQIIDMLKSDPRTSRIKIIVLTADTMEENMIRAFDRGVDAYLTKPVSLKYLRKRIDVLLDKADDKTAESVLNGGKTAYSKEEKLFLARCRDIIDANLSKEDFSINFLADKLAMSHSSLYKKIKSMTGKSLIEFINDYKIYKAVQMFNSGVTSIEVVYTKCGFKDSKNFREMFKRKMNTSPKQYVEGL